MHDEKMMNVRGFYYSNRHVKLHYHQLSTSRKNERVRPETPGACLMRQGGCRPRRFLLPPECGSNSICITFGH